MLDGERRFCGQHCGGTGHSNLAVRRCGCMCIHGTQASLIKHCHAGGTGCRCRVGCGKWRADTDTDAESGARVPCLVCPWVTRLCCLLVDGRVDFAAITAHQPANCSKRAPCSRVRADELQEARASERATVSPWPATLHPGIPCNLDVLSAPSIQCSWLFAVPA